MLTMYNVLGKHMLGLVDEHDFSIYSSEVDHFSYQKEGSGLCHDSFLPCWFLLPLLISLVPFLNLEVYCPCTDEEKYICFP